MKQVAPEVRNLARQLLLHEAGGHPEEMAHGTEGACLKLRFHLARFIGLVGFAALLSRALALAQTEFPWLSAVQVKPDGSLEGLREAQSKQDGGDEAAEGYVALLAQFLGLLILFIGEALTLRQMHEVWPESLMGDTISGLKEKTEG